MKLTCVIPWNEQEQLYKTICSMDKSLLFHLVSMKILSHAKNIDNLPNIFEVEVIVDPKFIGNEATKVFVFTKIPVPIEWFQSQEILEANKYLISRDKENIEFWLVVKNNRVKVFEKQALTLYL